MPQPKRYVDAAARKRAERQRKRLNRDISSRLNADDKPANRTILSLCDYSGTWSKPYQDAGYHVIQIDLKNSQDVRLMKIPEVAIHGVLAAPPCTHFAISGARWWAGKGDAPLLEGLSVIDACLRIVMVTRPKWWVLENPKGRLKDYIGQPVMKFNPCDYGDGYTKETHLWGDFNKNLPFNKVEITEPAFVLNMKGSGEQRRAARSITPAGFALAFFLANP